MEDDTSFKKNSTKAYETYVNSNKKRYREANIKIQTKNDIVGTIWEYSLSDTNFYRDKLMKRFNFYTFWRT